MKKPLLVGEMNPYGADPDFALYPLPENATGGRLVRIMDLTRGDYLEKFDRANLCVGRWSLPLAREAAVRLQENRGAFDHVVLLGSKVCTAFGEKFDPFTWRHARRPDGMSSYPLVVLPHPSGLNRAWNVPGAVDRAREVLQCSGVLPYQRPPR
jgi:uracil-DNA glycosylase